MLPEDQAAIAGLIARIESWPATLEQQRVASAAGLQPLASAKRAATSGGGSSRRRPVSRRSEDLRLSSSLRALPGTRKSHMMASSLPQRPPVYTRRPTVGAHLGPGSHDVAATPPWLGGDMAVREPSRPSHVFVPGKPRPLLPKASVDPMRGQSGLVGIPDLLTLRREKARDYATVSFMSCVERFGPQDEMLRRLRQQQQRLRIPQQDLPYDTGLAPQTPAWDFGEEPPGEP